MSSIVQVMEFSKPFKYQGITILQKKVGVGSDHDHLTIY